MKFFKYHGTGNDFVLIEEQNESLSAQQIQHICHRRYGIGADGVVFFKKETHSNIRLSVFNSDGKKASMCGNALRCLVQYLRDEGSLEKAFSLHIGCHQYQARIEGDHIHVLMGAPCVIEEKGAIGQHLFYHIDSGTDHLVVFTNKIKSASFLEDARYLRYHPHFSPSGVNVNFAKLMSPSHFYVRTYEKGVEEETFSCGTGGAAVCMAAWKEYGTEGRIKVEFHSKESLQFDLFVSNGLLKSIEMIGIATRVFAGTWE